jgi:hypothetical protein
VLSFGSKINYNACTSTWNFKIFSGPPLKEEGKIEEEREWWGRGGDGRNGGYGRGLGGGGRQVYDHAKFKIFLGKDPWIHRFEGLGRPWGHDREGHGHGREEA